MHGPLEGRKHTPDDGSEYLSMFRLHCQNLILLCRVSMMLLRRANAHETIMSPAHKCTPMHSNSAKSTKQSNGISRKGNRDTLAPILSELMRKNGCWQAAHLKGGTYLRAYASDACGWTPARILLLILAPTWQPRTHAHIDVRTRHDMHCTGT